MPATIGTSTGRLARIHAGDTAIIDAENPVDLAWKWTAADKLFLKLIREVHCRDMRVIIDYSWNHTGNTFWAWKDLL